MIIYYIAILLLSALTSLVLRVFGTKTYLQIGGALFLVLSVLITLFFWWLNWKIKNSPYP